MILSSLHAKYLPEESLRAVSQKHLLKLSEALLAVIANEVSEADISLKVSEPGRKVVLFRVKRTCAWTKTGRRGVDAPVFAILLVY